MGRFLISASVAFSPDLRHRAAAAWRLELPAHSPDLNAFVERFVLSIKSECLNKLIPLGERHLRLAVSEFVEHYPRWKAERAW